MFAKNKVSQSLIDAVNKIMSEKEVESKEQFLSEGWDEMLKSVKDKNKPQPSGGAGKKQGSRYGGSKQKEEPEEKEVKEQYQNPLEFSNKPKRTHSYDAMPDSKKRPKYDAVPTSRQLGAKPQPKNESVEELQAKNDASTKKELSHAENLGWHIRKQTYGRVYTHPKHGHIAMNRYGEWQHKPESDFKGGKGQLIAHGQADDLDKHLSSLNKPKNEETEVKEELKGNQHKIDKNKNNKIDAEDFKMLRKEELKGDQHKIDANKNNKIDAHDFQLLRGRKKVKEDTFAGKLLNSLVESEEIQKAINEVMKKDATAGDWIHDFVHSKNPKFAGKSTKERQKMALGAYYAKQNEEVELDEVKIPRSPNRRGVPVGAPSSADIAAHFDSKKSEEDRHLAAWKKSEHAPNDNDRATDENPQIGGDLHAIHKAAVKYMKTVKEPNPTTHSRFGSGTHFGDLAWAIAHRFHKERVTKTRLDNSFELNGFELNEVSKSEIDHHYDKWTTSDSAPNHHDAGDDDKIHKSALKYLKSTNEPKENHEKIAMHIADKFHGSGIDEAAPKKMDDVAKQNLEPAKKGVVGTVKSDFKNFKSFLAGKKETNEEVESLDEDRYLMKYLLSRGINPKYVDRNTRVGHAKSNEFKKWKADHLNSLIVTRESNEMPFDGPYIKTKKNVKDKSGAVHTPMSRARNLARAALKSVQDKTKIK